MKIVNKKAHFDYFITETLEAGIALTGPEVKSVKSGRIRLEGAYVRFLQNEPFLVNADIPPYLYAKQNNYDSKRTRKLLLRKKQIISLSTKLEQMRLTLVPISCYTTRGLVKLEIGLGKHKQTRDQREEIKRRDQEREVARDLRQKS
jgi:SsrA-binding protein